MDSANIIQRVYESYYNYTKNKGQYPTQLLVSGELYRELCIEVSRNIYYSSPTVESSDMFMGMYIILDVKHGINYLEVV